MVTVITEILSVIIILWTASFFHEVGHLLCGLIKGFSFRLIIVGPLGIKKDDDDSKIKLYLEKRIAYWGGMAGTVPKNETVENMDIFQSILIAGPIASLVACLLLTPLGWYTRTTIYGSTLLFSGLASFGTFLVTALPLKFGMFYTDGLRYRILRKGDERSREERILYTAAFSAEIHGSHRNLNMNDIAQLQESACARNRVMGSVFSLLYHKEMGNEEEADLEMSKLKELEKEVPKKYIDTLLAGGF